MRRQIARTAKTSVLMIYYDERSGEQVMTMRFDDVPAGSRMSDHGVLTIKGEGTWNVTCSNG